MVAVGVVEASGEGLNSVEAGGSSLLPSVRFVCADCSHDDRYFPGTSDGLGGLGLVKAKEAFGLKPVVATVELVHSSPQCLPCAETLGEGCRP